MHMVIVVVDHEIFDMLKKINKKLTLECTVYHKCYVQT